MAAMTARILLIEDETAIADTLSFALQREGYAVDWHRLARDGEAALAGAQLVILDVGLPDDNGFELLKRIRRHSEVPVLMLTARADEVDRIVGLELGADDYVVKPFSPREVVARVQALLRRTPARPTSPPPIVIGELELDLWAHQVRLAGRVVALTPKEFRVLEVLGRSPGRVFSREELLARAFGPGYDGLDRTVDVHITNLRKKIESDKQPRYVLTEHGVGYRLATNDDL